MSRRTAMIEEFDDDTDLPLPSQPLPNTGGRGALLEEIEDLYIDEEPTAGPSPLTSHYPQPPQTSTSGPKILDRRTADMTPFKKWSCIYPIYIDAKRPYGTGERRVARAKSVWWPLSSDMAEALARLGLQHVHEVDKSHPRDWENPGRIRVQWKKDGRYLNQKIKSKKQLLEMISIQIQHLKPENVPRPPFTTSSEAPPSEPAPAVISSKGKQPSKAPAPQQHQTFNKRRLPVPPSPYPALSNRFSPYSPLLESGVLVDTVKAGMNAQQEAAATAAPAPGGQIGGQKGKRKVVRVRG